MGTTATVEGPTPLAPLAAGFCFGEGPRWFEGLLWFSDMLGEAVRTLFLVTSSDAYPGRLVGTRLSRVDTVIVDIPGVQGAR